MIPAIINLARRGNTYTEIAELMGICDRTFYNWLNNYFDEESLHALKNANKDPIANAEEALYKRAVGYSAVETKTHMTKSGTIKTRNVVKHYPPSELALKYFLGNKNPEKWKEKREVTIDDPNANEVKYFKFSLAESPDELDARGGEEPDSDDGK